jgi:hypothetical protein
VRSVSNVVGSIGSNGSLMQPALTTAIGNQIRSVRLAAMLLGDGQPACQIPMGRARARVRPRRGFLDQL